MNIKRSKKSGFNRLIEKACKGTAVSTREFYREIASNGYKNFKDLDLTLEELKSIVLDIADSKETTTTHIHAKAPKFEHEAQY